MTAAIAKTCLEQDIAVTFDGRQYHRINAIVLRKYISNERKKPMPPRLVLELYDGYSNSVIYAPIEAVEVNMPVWERTERDATDGIV